MSSPRERQAGAARPEARHAECRGMKPKYGEGERQRAKRADKGREQCLRAANEGGEAPLL